MIKQALGRRAAQHAPVKAGCVGRMNKAIGLMTVTRVNRPVPAHGAEILVKFDIDVLVAATGWASLTKRRMRPPARRLPMIQQL
jgi:hypothetical protein